MKKNQEAPLMKHSSPYRIYQFYVENKVWAGVVTEKFTHELWHFFPSYAVTREMERLESRIYSHHASKINNIPHSANIYKVRAVHQF